MMLEFSERRQWTRMVLSSPRDALPASCKAVLIALADFADFRDGSGAHPGEQRLSRAVDVDVRTVRRALSLGRHLGFIEQTAAANPKAGRSAVYALTLPPGTGRTTGQERPVETLTTGQECTAEISTTGQERPVETLHHRAGMHPPPDGNVPPPNPYTNTNPGVSPHRGTSPEPSAATHTDRPPSRFCTRHPLGFAGRCGDCANARNAHNAWNEAAAAADVARAAVDDLERQRRRRLIAACPDCHDNHGRRDDGTGERLIPCEHPRLARQGAAAHA